MAVFVLIRIQKHINNVLYLIGYFALTGITVYPVSYTHLLELASRLLAIESLSGLVSMTVAQLTKIRGIGKVKAIQLQCIGELSRRCLLYTSYNFTSWNWSGGL